MMRRLFALMLALCILAGAGFCAPQTAQAASATVYVVSNMVDVYQSASTSSQWLGTMSYGESMKLVSTDGDWAKVKNSYGATGYCKAGSVSTADPNTLKVTARINADNTPIYKQPSTKSAVWMKLRKGLTFTAVAITRDNEWVRLKNGNYYAYAQAKYLSTVSAATPAPADAPSGETGSVLGKMYVTAAKLPVYAKSSESSRLLGHIYLGESLTCLSIDGDWAKVKNASGTVGHCSASGLSSANPNSLSRKVTVNTSGAPIYRVPDTATAAWMKLEKGFSCTAVAVSSDGKWTRLKNGDYYAYIQSKYVSSGSEAPTATPKPTATAKPTSVPTNAPSGGLSGKVYAVAAKLPVYANASTNSKLLGHMYLGESLTCLSVDGDWAKVQNANGAVGHCMAGGLSSKNPNKLSEKVTVNTSGAPIYRVPDTATAVWMKLNKGFSCIAVAVSSDGAWARLKNGDYYAYIQTKYVTFAGTQPTVAPTASLKPTATPVPTAAPAPTPTATPAVQPKPTSGTAYAAANTVPLRKEAASDAKIVETIPYGESVALLNSVGSWMQVRSVSGKTGYCIGSQLTQIDPNTLSQKVTINTANAPIYALPDDSAAVWMNLARGFSCTAVAVTPDGKWARLKNGNYYAYILKKYVDFPAPQQPSTVYANVNLLSIFKSASSTSAVLGTASYGETLTQLESDDTWAKVRDASGVTGYCKLKKLTSKDPNTYNKTMYVTTANAPIYHMPDASTAVWTRLQRGASYTAVAVTPDKAWYRLKNGAYYGYIEAKYVSTSPDSGGSGGGGGGSTVDKVIALAKQYLGVPYVYGGQSPSGFDCSGFVYYVFKNAAGISLKRTAYTQGYDDRFPKITGISGLKVGDVLYFDTVTNDSDKCDHAGIYLGNNQFIHASSGGGKVIISTLGTNDKSYYYHAYSWARRILS